MSSFTQFEFKASKTVQEKMLLLAISKLHMVPPYNGEGYDTEKIYDTLLHEQETLDRKPFIPPMQEMEFLGGLSEGEGV